MKFRNRSSYEDGRPRWAWMRLGHWAVVGFLLVAASPAYAWGPEGHKTVALLAQKLIVGTTTADQVRKTLGDISLEDAAVWADCAKGVSPAFTYPEPGKFPECAVFETPKGEAEMIDFVRRNADTCDPKVEEETPCHKEYHYADIAPQHDHYDPGFHGARKDDIVVAVTAAILVLQGRSAPAPFSIKNKKEAVLLLAHYVGDLHQPLHVGAIYLDTAGHRVNPDAGVYDNATRTRGGNLIDIVSGGTGNLHTTTWDAIPAEFGPEMVDDAWLSDARSVAATSGAPTDWSSSWASETQKVAVRAFAGLSFGAQQTNKHWTVALPASYPQLMKEVKKRQLTAAGARLAQILLAVWPDSPPVAHDGHHNRRHHHSVK